MIALVRRGESGGGGFPKLDLSPVQFPSDDLTIRVLRQTHRDSFDVFSEDSDQPRFFFEPTGPGHADSTVASMVYWERMLAANAYAVSAGIEGISTGLSDAEMKGELTDLYVRYRLASGPHHAAELIRGFEQQAAALGKNIAP